MKNKHSVKVDMRFVETVSCVFGEQDTVMEKYEMAR